MRNSKDTSMDVTLYIKKETKYFDDSIPLSMDVHKFVYVSVCVFLYTKMGLSISLRTVGAQVQSSTPFF